MSIKLMAAAWELDIPSTEKMVLLCLCDFSNDAGVCWPSVPTIARKCSKGERTIQSAIQWLRKEGFCTYDETPGKPHRFTLDPRKICTPANSAVPQKTTQTPANLADEPLRTTIGLSDDKPTRARKAVSFVVPDWVPKPAWTAFLAMRKAKGAWPTADAVDLMVGKLERWRAQGHDPGEILNTSTMNNWTGLFEPKAPANDRQPADEIRNPYVRAITRSQAARREAERTGLEFG